MIDQKEEEETHNFFLHVEPPNIHQTMASIGNSNPQEGQDDDSSVSSRGSMPSLITREEQSHSSSTDIDSDDGSVISIGGNGNNDAPLALPLFMVAFYAELLSLQISEEEKMQTLHNFDRYCATILDHDHIPLAQYHQRRRLMGTSVSAPNWVADYLSRADRLANSIECFSDAGSTGMGGVIMPAHCHTPELIIIQKPDPGLHQVFNGVTRNRDIILDRENIYSTPAWGSLDGFKTCLADYFRGGSIELVEHSTVYQLVSEFLGVREHSPFEVYQRVFARGE